MKEFISVLSNRELAILIWIFVGVCFAITVRSKESVSFLKEITSIIFTTNLLMIFQIMIIYLIGIIFLLHKLGIWGTAYDLKDTVIWILIVGFVLIFRAVKAEGVIFFRKCLVESITWTIVIEFMINLYSFGLIVELILIPFIILVSVMYAFAENDTKQIKIANILVIILIIFGFFMLLFAILNIVRNYHDVFTVRKLISLFLPSILTITFIPFIYFLALWGEYQDFFNRLKLTKNKEDEIRKVKSSVLLVANINLNKLKRINATFDKVVLYNDINIHWYIKEISD